jgi:UPF0716 protein FxsA
MPAVILFFAILFIELVVLIQVGGVIGAVNAVLLVFLTAIVGIAIIFRQGFKVMQRAQLQAVQGQPAAVEMIEALLLVVAAVFLLVPGFVTDFFGFLLITPLRHLMAKTALGRWMAGRTTFRHSHYRQGSFEVLEGEYREEDDKKS